MDHAVALHLEVDAQAILEVCRHREVPEDLLVELADPVRRALGADVHDLAVLQEVVERDTHEKGGAARAGPAQDEPDVPPAEAAVDGALEDAHRTPTNDRFPIHCSSPA